MINWKVRLQNKSWVTAFISQVMIVAQMVLSGLNMLDITDYQLTEHVQTSVLTFANAVFAILSMLGVIQDPTTKGISDSERAMTYKDPK